MQRIPEPQGRLPKNSSPLDLSNFLPGFVINKYGVCIQSAGHAEQFYELCESWYLIRQIIRIEYIYQWLNCLKWFMVGLLAKEL